MKINVKSAMEFLKNFDPIEFKYNYLSDSIKLSAGIKAKLEEYENSYQFGSLTKQEYSGIVDNLRLVYNDDQVVNQDVEMYHLTEKKIIHQYLGIPMLDKMFDEDYFNFEWDMHVGQNFKEHRNDYNRDHFLHQVRNLVMMFNLLNDENIKLYQIIKSISPSVHSLPSKEGKVPEYMKKKEQQFFSYVFNQKKYQFDCFLEDYKAIIGSVDDEDYLHEYYTKYVIFASTFLSALFHDMGYPICHFLEVRHRVSDYNPYLYMFTHNSVDSFDQLFSKMNDSLLFTIVSREEIKSRLNINKKRKYDHGVYSAIAFLLPFYESGLINTLSPEKQCAIEIASIAIYNHTASYNCIKFSENNNYYQPVFRQNPVSFLLRFCDDLQEWDRRYFEISTDSDLVICTKCGTPLVNNAQNDNNCTDKSDIRNYRMQYYCLCDTNSPKHIKFDSFLKRKIYVVRTSDSVIFDLKELIYLEKQCKILVSRINYNLYRLLKMCRINVDYATYRLSELNSIKRIVNQNFNLQSEGKSTFDYIALDYFITSNPILIKVRILEKFIKIADLNFTDMDTLIDAILNKVFKIKRSIWEKYSGKKCRKNNLPSIYTYLRDVSLPFYLRILNYVICLRDKVITLDTDELILQSIKKFNQSYYDIMVKLVNDCIMQYSQMPKNNIFSIEYLQEEKYYKIYEPNDEKVLRQCILKYCNKDNLYNQRKNNNIVDYYTDLYFFDVINRYIEEKESLE